MKLYTQIPIDKQSPAIDHRSSIVSIGSCFAVNMAEKFEYFQFKNTVNPFGILFHPLAIEKFVNFSIDKKAIDESDIFFHNERWHFFDAHSDLSDTEKIRLLDNINTAIKAANTSLKEATHVIITLGTAWAYRNVESGNLVANCHKVPQTRFTKELLSIETIAESLTKTLRLIENHNPAATVILTVSPVRHIKDGFVENQRSKAHLIAAIHQVVDKHSSDQRPATKDQRPTPNDQRPTTNDQKPATNNQRPTTTDQRPTTNNQKPTYFPSYEILMDELRDYRFYADDLLHPNQTAIDYIWERFADAWISKDAIPVMTQVGNIRKALAHRAFNPDSASHRDFLKTTADTIEALQVKFPHITF